MHAVGVGPFGGKWIHGLDESPSPGAWGTAFTSGNASDGSWVEMCPDLAYDAHGIVVHFSCSPPNVASTGQTIVDVGWDTSGGTSYGAVINDLLGANVAGDMTGNNGSGNASGLGIYYYFPVFIPAGSAIAFRGKSQGTTVVCQGFVWALTSMYQPHHSPTGQDVVTFGIDTSACIGTAVTISTDASEGAWTEIGTLDNDYYHFQLGVDCTDTTQSLGVSVWDVAVGDATNKKVVITNQPFLFSASEQLHGGGWPRMWDGWYPAKAGDKIYVRGWHHTNTTDTPHHAAVYATR